MTTTTWLLLLALLAIAAYLLLRITFRLVSWRLVALILIVALLAATGLLDTTTIWSELDHLATNLFGGNP
jgi:hypothetical protein